MTLLAGTCSKRAATGRILKNLLGSDLAMPKDYWAKMSSDDFRNLYCNNRFPDCAELTAQRKRPPTRRPTEIYLTNVTLVAGEVNSWIASSQTSGASNRTGTPGRPASAHLVKAEMRDMHSNGRLLSTLAETARHLETWLKNKHPGAAPMTHRSIENAIRDEFNALKAGR